jgi:hypothetical protein
MVVPIIVVAAFAVGMLMSVALGIACSTFIFVGAFYRTGVVKFVANGKTMLCPTRFTYSLMQRTHCIILLYALTIALHISNYFPLIDVGLTVRSTIERNIRDGSWLDNNGDLIQILVLQVGSSKQSFPRVIRSLCTILNSDNIFVCFHLFMTRRITYFLEMRLLASRTS